MADREYKIVYVVDEAQALRSIDSIQRALVGLDKTIDQVGVKLRDLPKQLKAQDTTVAAGQMNSALASILSNATNARTALGAVGQNTGSMTSAAGKAATLAANLAAVTANAAAAGPAVAGVGAGMPAGRGAGGGGGGGGAFTDIAMGVARRTAFAGVRAAVGAVNQGAEARKDYFETATKRFNDFRKELIPLANLAGDTDVTNKTITDQLIFQKSTGMTADEALNYREQFQGSVGAAKLRGNINDDTASKLEVQGALFAQRYGLEPGMTGKLTGLLGEYGKIPTAEAGAARLEGIATHLNVYGVDAVKKYLPGLMGLQAQLVDENGGKFTEPESLAARLALTSPRAKSPDVAAQQIRLANRLMSRFERDDVEGAPGFALKQLGIKPEDSYEEKITKLKSKLLAPDAMEWLKANGFNNSTERDAVIVQAKITDQVDKATGRTDPAIRAKLDNQRGAAATNNSAFLGTEIGKQKLAEVGAFATEIRAGQGQSRFERARLEAETRLRQRREIDTPGSSAAEALQTVANFGLRSGRDDRIESEIYNDLMARTGVTEKQISAKFPEFGQAYQSGFAGVRAQFGPEERAQMYGQIEDFATQQAAGGGGGGGGGGLDKLNQAADLLKQGVADLNKGKPQPKAGGPPPGFVGGRP